MHRAVSKCVVIDSSRVEVQEGGKASGAQRRSPTAGTNFQQTAMAKVLDADAPFQNNFPFDRPLKAVTEGRTATQKVASKEQLCRSC